MGSHLLAWHAVGINSKWSTRFCCARRECLHTGRRVWEISFLHPSRFLRKLAEVKIKPLQMLLWKHTHHKQELDFCSCHPINTWGLVLMSDQLYLVHVLECLVFQLWTAVIVINQALCSLATGCFINESASDLHFFTISSNLFQILFTSNFVCSTLL